MKLKYVLGILVLFGISSLVYAQQAGAGTNVEEGQTDVMGEELAEEGISEEKNSEEILSEEEREKLSAFSDIFKDSTAETSVTELEEELQNKSFIHRIDMILGLTPALFINTHTQDSAGKYISAPSPIVMPVYIGMSVPNYTFVSVQPSLRFFMSYDLVADVDGTNLVLPSEIENRTSQTLNFLLNVPVVFKLNFNDKNSLSIFGGVALLMRFALTPNGVEDTDPGTLGSVRSDIDYMNSWFWEKGRFLYVSAGADWLFYRGTTKFGPEVTIFFPIAIFSDKSLDSMMISAGFKVEF